MSNYNIVAISFFSIILVLSPVSTPAADGAQEPPEKYRTYIAIEYVQQSMSDEFDGYSFYSDGINLYTVPKLESGAGFRASLGFRLRRQGAEVSYTTTSHDTEWLGIRDKARHHEVGADAKYWLNPDGVFQPYATAGLLLHFLVLKNGAIDLIPDTLVTIRENYSGGIGLRFRGGLRTRITQFLALRGEATFRIGRFRTLSGRAINSIAASGWVFSAGLVYTFEK